MRWRRFATVVAFAAGLLLLTAVVASHLFSRADAGEAATDLVRPELTVAGVAQHRADFELTKRATDEMVDRAMPDVGVLLAMTPSQLRGRYPNIAAAGSQRDTIYPFAEKVVANLERHQSDFAAADAIPLAGLPITSAPWVALAVIAALITLGLLVSSRQTEPAWLWALAVLGLVLVIAPFATSYPEKARKTGAVLDSLNVSHELAAQTRTHFATMVAAMDEFEQRVMPDVAKATGVSLDARNAQLAARYPDFSEGRRQFTAVFDRYDARVTIRERGVDVVNEAKRFPLEVVMWWTVLPGLAVLLAAGWALARVSFPAGTGGTSRRSRRSLRSSGSTPLG